MSLRNQLWLLLAAATASNAVSGIENDATSVTSIAPAAATVSASSPAGVDLFPVERVQLTEKSLQATNAQLPDTDLLELFGFQNTDGSLTTRRSKQSGSCKVFPGDWNFPPSLVWKVFDLVLGGALEKTTPVAAPCYKSSGLYDAAKCADVSARFMTDNLQYVEPKGRKPSISLTYTAVRTTLLLSCGHCFRDAHACQPTTRPEHVLLVVFPPSLLRYPTWPRCSWQSTLLGT